MSVLLFRFSFFCKHSNSLYVSCYWFKSYATPIITCSTYSLTHLVSCWLLHALALRLSLSPWYCNQNNQILYYHCHLKSVTNKNHSNRPLYLDFCGFVTLDSWFTVSFVFEIGLVSIFLIHGQNWNTVTSFYSLWNGKTKSEIIYQISHFRSSSEIPILCFIGKRVIPNQVSGVCLIIVFAHLIFSNLFILDYLHYANIACLFLSLHSITWDSIILSHLNFNSACQTSLRIRSFFSLRRIS